MNQQSRTTGFVSGSLIIMFGVLALIEILIDLDAWIGVALLTIGSIGIYFIYARDRNQKWQLVITYVMLAIAGLVTLLELGVL